MFFFMKPLAGDIWFYVALAYVLVSMSMWIIARFSPLEWYLLKNPNLDGSLCHEHDPKVLTAPPPPSTSFAHRDSGYPEEDDAEHQPCCHHLSSSPRIGTTKGRGGKFEDDDTQVEMDGKDNFQESDESDFNKHQQTARQGRHGGLRRLGMGETKSSNEFQIYNEGCSCDNPSPSHHGRNAVFRPVNRAGPRDNPLDLLEDMPPFDVNAAHDDPSEDIEGHPFINGRHQQQQNSLRHSHNETELLCSKNDFTLSNSFWFMIGTLMQQGSDLNPKVKEFPLFVKLPVYLSQSSLSYYKLPSSSKPLGHQQSTARVERYKEINICITLYSY